MRRVKYDQENLIVMDKTEDDHVTDAVFETKAVQVESRIGHRVFTSYVVAGTFIFTEHLMRGKTQITVPAANNDADFDQLFQSVQGEYYASL